MNRYILIVLIFIVAVTGCRDTTANQKKYDLKGKVVAVEPDKHLVTISHEEVKDFMPAMTMPFTLRDDEYLNLLAVGDDITATLVVDSGESWIENPIITRQSTDPSPTTGIVPAKAG